MDVANMASIHQPKSKYRKFTRPFPPAAYAHHVPWRQGYARCQLLLERETPLACRLLDVWVYVKQQAAGGLEGEGSLRPDVLA
jgi:hypothetical protein